MQVNKNNITHFLTATNMCFMVPVCQRNYNWKEENCKWLWTDIWQIFDEPSAHNHFLGTIRFKSNSRELSAYDKWSTEELFPRTHALVKECVEIWSIPEKYQNTSKGGSSEKRHPQFRFSMIGLGIGDEIAFTEDPSKIATVIDNTHAIYNGERTLLSSLAARLIGKTDELWVRGPQYFIYGDATPDGLGNEMESYAR